MTFDYYIHIPKLPFVFEDGGPMIISNQKKHIITLTDDEIIIDDSGVFTRLSLPSDLIKKYKFI